MHGAERRLAPQIPRNCVTCGFGVSGMSIVVTAHEYHFAPNVKVHREGDEVLLAYIGMGPASGRSGRSTVIRSSR
jgi:hypothetical protein